MPINTPLNLPKMRQPSIEHIPLSLYIHIPWCVKKCPYCDFNSHTKQQDTPFDDYVNALIADAQRQAMLAQGREIRSIFIGGGTPSLLPISLYYRLFKALYRIFDVAQDCEITLEANPATVEHAPFEEYLAVGINRLSLGVQSFHQKHLTILDRVHGDKQAIEAIIAAKAAGFERLNVDLMHGLPQQNADQALEDLKIASQSGASHISWYQLTIEPNTAFYRRPPSLPSEQILGDIETLGQVFLQTQGFVNYEVSAWHHQDDRSCWHNMNYWQFGDYLAIGAGAHGKITIDSKLINTKQLTKTTEPAGVQIYRFSKSRLPKDYLNYQTYPKFINFAPIAQNELACEYMMNALRLKNGTSVLNFEYSTGLDFAIIKNIVDKLKQQKLLVDCDDKIISTATGFCYVNHLLKQFL